MEVAKSDLYKIQKGVCRGCWRWFSEHNMTIDHIVPASKGGEDSFGNIQLLCGGCNAMKGVKSMRELQRNLVKTGNVEGWGIFPFLHPEEEKPNIQQRLLISNDEEEEKAWSEQSHLRRPQAK